MKYCIRMLDPLSFALLVNRIHNFPAEVIRLLYRTYLQLMRLMAIDALNVQNYIRRSIREKERDERGEDRREGPGF